MFLFTKITAYINNVSGSLSYLTVSVLGKNQLVGDMLCLGGAVLFAIVTVLQELSIKYTDVVEYLGLLGLFGSVVSGIQM